MDDNRVKEKSIEEQYPSVDLAYDITLQSYDIAFKRSDLIDGNADKLLTWATATNLAIFTIVITKFIQPEQIHKAMNIWFYIASFLYVVMVFIVHRVKLAGWFAILNPEILWKGWLHKSHWQFKKDILAFGRKDFVNNMTLIKKKAKLLGYATFSFLLQMAVLVKWVMDSL